MSTHFPSPCVSRFRRSQTSLLVSALFCPVVALAAPHGGVVTAGQAAIHQAGSVTNINQSSQKAAINWQGFGVQAGETVNFNQPNASAVTLNRVLGNERSVIAGALNANGKVFLINANGVLFTKGASVNTAGLVASTLNMTDSDFLQGNYVFRGDGSGNGSIINMGTINAADGGYVALLGDQVRNEGVIVAKLGTVALSSGQRITLNFNGDSLMKVSLDEGTLNSLVENGHAIHADGGKVILTAKAANNLLDAQVNNTGIVQARTIGDLKGDIHVYAHGGTANVNGTLDASAPETGDGGFIETSGDYVKVADGAFVTTKSANGKTGTWLIDPNDFTVAASGGDMTGLAVEKALANNDFTIETQTMGTSGGNGDIHINDSIHWSSNNTLTLDAERDININNAITVGGAGGELALNYGGDYNIRTKASYSGAVLDANGKPVAKQDTSGGVYGSVTFADAANKDGLIINGKQYKLIHSMDELAAISWAPTGHYALAKDLDSTQVYTAAVVEMLDGTFTGLGHVINDLVINAPSFSSVALFGQAAANSHVRDIGIVNGSVAGNMYVGLLVGLGYGGVQIHNAYAMGNVQAANGGAGGLAGAMFPGGVLSDSFAVADVVSNGGNGVGGLAGMLLDGTVLRSHAQGNVNVLSGTTTNHSFGGLVGSMDQGGTLEDSYATGEVSTNALVKGIGGLIGKVTTGTVKNTSVTNAFATGRVQGGEDIGGLIGEFAMGSKGFDGIIDNTYATGDVTGSRSAGGLIGKLLALGGLPGDRLVLTNSHATGNVSISEGGSEAGGAAWIR